MIVNTNGIVQAMQLIEGKVNLTGGTHYIGRLIHCVEDATLTVKWPTGTTATIGMLAGEDYAFKGEVTVSSGKVHLD